MKKMKKISKKKILLALIILVPLGFLASPSSCPLFDKTFQGKLIDAETLKPIEGAVVVAVWRKTRAMFIDTFSKFKDAKETLTDKNGEWSITGPEGDEDRVIPALLHLIGIYMTEKPSFVYYKPGYRRDIRGGFSAYPYIDREHNLEGIVLSRPGETWEEIREHSKKYSVGMLCFIPAKDPEKKLRNLDFSFKYPENVKTVGWQRGMSEVYLVIGLKKAKTREERLRAQPSPPTDYIEELPILYKMINEESKGFGLKPIGRRKPK